MIRPSVTEVRIAWAPDRSVTARLVGMVSPGRPAVLLAHGAGAGQDHPGVVGLRDGLAGAGQLVLTFNYPYVEEGRRRPDRTEVLLACHRAAQRWLHTHTDGPVVLAGRSMGGRMGTLLAADGEPCAGLMLYAYPLHPIGKPDQLRVEHLPRIRVPMLFVSGTRDTMARLDPLQHWIGSLPNATLHLVPSADHSLRGATDEIVAVSADWLETLR